MFTTTKFTFVEDVTLTPDAIMLVEAQVIEFRNKLIDPDEPQKMTIDNDLIIKTLVQKVLRC
jgi:hypothetical protein